MLDEDTAESAVPSGRDRRTGPLANALVELGFDLGTFGPAKDGVDGVWGEASKGALIAFQSAAGLVSR